MANKFWVREPGVSHFTGPLEFDELSERARAGRFAAGAEALLDRGQSNAELRQSADWRPVDDVLARRGPLEAAERTEPHRQRWITDIRGKTHYGRARSLVDIVAIVSILFAVIFAIAGLSQRADGQATFLVVLSAGVSVVVTLTVRALAVIGIDVADAVHRHVRGSD